MMYCIFIQYSSALPENLMPSCPCPHHRQLHSRLYRQHYHPTEDRTPAWLRKLWMWF